MFLNLKRKRKKVFIINIFLIAAIILAVIYSSGCKISDSDNVSSSTAGDKIVIGCDATYPPFEYVKEGNIEGFDIDIALKIAEKMDKEIEIIPIKWDSTYQIPEDLQLDMIISAIPIAREKEDLIDFSSPYFVMEYMLISLYETDIIIKEDLEGKVVGILESDKKNLSEDYLLTYNIEEYNDVVIMFEDLRNKNIEGILISLPMGVSLIAENNGIYSVLEVVKSNKEFGIVFRKGSALKEEVDSILEDIMGDGTYDEIYSKWFNYS